MNSPIFLGVLRSRPLVATLPKNSIKPRTLFGAGFAIGLETLVNLEFRADRPYRACLLCGRIYQTDDDRDLSVCNSLNAVGRRQEWALIHAQRHPASLHRQLRQSGNGILPEAAYKLAAFGLIDISGLLFDEEIKAAYAESSATPTFDADNKQRQFTARRGL